MSSLVIVGASLAGAKAAETLRAEGFDGRIVLIGDETERPYERPPLSKGYLHGNDPREKAFVHDEGWYGQHDVELLLGIRVTGLDPKAHTVTLDGFEPLRYDKLLLATGSRARRLDVPGADLTGVRYLRTLPDADVLLEYLKPGAHVVVIGAGWIGLETAAAARALAPKRPWSRWTACRCDGCSATRSRPSTPDLHRAHGVDFRFEAGVAEFVGSGGALTSVRLDRRHRDCRPMSPSSASASYPRPNSPPRAACRSTTAS